LWDNRIHVGRGGGARPGASGADTDRGRARRAGHSLCLF
jgi:hypothetical protein